MSAISPALFLLWQFKMSIMKPIRLWTCFGALALFMLTHWPGLLWHLMKQSHLLITPVLVLKMSAVKAMDRWTLHQWQNTHIQFSFFSISLLFCQSINVFMFTELKCQKRKQSHTERKKTAFPFQPVNLWPIIILFRSPQQAVEHWMIKGLWIFWLFYTMTCTYATQGHFHVYSFVFRQFKSFCYTACTTHNQFACTSHDEI